LCRRVGAFIPKTGKRKKKKGKVLVKKEGKIRLLEEKEKACICVSRGVDGSSVLKNKESKEHLCQLSKKRN